MKNIRMATLADGERLLEIYQPYIETTTISFEYKVPSLEEFRSRMVQYGSEYPYLVCEIDGTIVGYAYAHRYAERAAYGWCAELSVYVAQDCLHGGIGTALYTALMEILKLQQVHTVYGCITWPNERSIGLHKKLGFIEVGRFVKAGYKMGNWIDVVWMGKEILPRVEQPREWMSIEEIDAVMVDEICKNCASLIKEKNK